MPTTERIAFAYETYYTCVMPRGVLTVRLDESTRRRLVSAARKRARTPSDVVRAAIGQWLDAEEGSSTGIGSYGLIADLVGSIRGGDPGRSVREARSIARTLRARRKRGRRRGR